MDKDIPTLNTWTKQLVPNWESITTIFILICILGLKCWLICSPHSFYNVVYTACLLYLTACEYGCTYFICFTIVLFPDSPAPANKEEA